MSQNSPLSATVGLIPNEVVLEEEAATEAGRIAGLFAAVGRDIDVGLGGCGPKVGLVDRDSDHVLARPVVIFERGALTGVRDVASDVHEIAVFVHVAAIAAVRTPEQAGRFDRELYDRGEAIGAVDVLIAGTTANRPDPTVMTRNVDAFERVDAIDVMSY